MNETDPLLASQVVVRVCLLLVAAIAMAGGARFDPYIHALDSIMPGNAY